MSSNLVKLAKALNVKVDYFFKKSTVNLRKWLSERKQNSGSKTIDSIKYRVIDRVERYLELEDILLVNNDFVNPIADIKIEKIADAEIAAGTLRHVWDLGLNPISSVIEMLEDNFIKVVEVDEPLDFDGLSSFVDDKIPGCSGKS